MRRTLSAIFLTAICLTACGQGPPSTTAKSAPPGAAGETVSNQPSDLQASTPQLIKTASLSLAVESVATASHQISGLVRQLGGEILGLEETHRGTVLNMKLQVPQIKLEETLTSFEKLGTVQNRSLKAEDVSSQIVDTAARLRNLRKTEATLLEIMGRSGSVGDVLKVAQELNNVRQTIEQTDAQLQNLQNRVAYSQINLVLRAKIQPTDAISTQLQETWLAATTSFGHLTTTLLKIGLWLLVYSPYWLTITLAIYFWRRRSLVRRSPPDS